MNRTALVLVIVGAVNWLAVGLLRFDFVAGLFGDNTIVSRIIYVLVGLAGLYCISLLFSSREDRAAH
jgi:uncharacterized protein